MLCRHCRRSDLDNPTRLENASSARSRIPAVHSRPSAPGVRDSQSLNLPAARIVLHPHPFPQSSIHPRMKSDREGGESSPRTRTRPQTSTKRRKARSGGCSATTPIRSRGGAISWNASRRHENLDGKRLRRHATSGRSVLAVSQLLHALVTHTEKRGGCLDRVSVGAELPDGLPA